MTQKLVSKTLYVYNIGIEYKIMRIHKSDMYKIEPKFECG